MPVLLGAALAAGVGAGAVVFAQSHSSSATAAAATENPPHVGPTVSPPSAKRAAAARPAVPKTGKFYLGVSSDPDTLSAYDAAAGIERTAVLGGYVSNGGQVMSIVKHSSGLHGTIPLVSWGVSFTDNAVLSGADDAYLKSQAKALAAYGKPVFLRLDWEMNGTWYPGWSSGAVTPEIYIESWRYIREYFWLEGADNVAFVWCPNVGDPAGIAAYDWYPGNAYVDWIALDAYPQSHLAATGGLLTGQDGLDSMAEQAAAHSKPLMLAEWAPSTPAPDVAEPFDVVFSWALKYPHTVKALIYFNYGSTKVDHFLVDHPVGAAAYRKLIKEHRRDIVGAS